MRRPTRIVLYVALALVCVALLVQGTGLQMPRALKMLTAVTATAHSSPVVVQSRAEPSDAAEVFSVDYLERSCTALSSIESSFNATSIAEGNVIWFNSALRVDGLAAQPASIFLNDSTISFAANGKSYSLAVPAATVVIRPGGDGRFDGLRCREQSLGHHRPRRSFGEGVSLRPGLPGSRRGSARGHRFGYLVGGLFHRHARGNREVAVGLRGLHHIRQRLQRARRQARGRGAASQGANLRAANNTGADGQDGSAGKPASFEAFLTGGAGGEGNSNFTGTFSATGALTPCPTGMSSSQATHTSRTTTTLTKARGQRP